MKSSRIHISAVYVRFFSLSIIIAFILVSSGIITGCGGSPKTKINLALDKYERMVDDYIETSRKVENGSMTSNDAIKKLGENVIERLVTTRQEVEEMIEEYQHELTADDKENYFRKLEAIDVMIRDKT